jgi:hypothetical protein
MWAMPCLFPGAKAVGNKGSKDKGKREPQKKALLTPKEKRKAKQEKKNKQG